MVETGGLPAHEVLVFPSGALPYHNTEWLFDVVLYLVFRLGGLPGVVRSRPPPSRSPSGCSSRMRRSLGEPAVGSPVLRAVIAAAVLLGCLPWSPPLRRAPRYRPDGLSRFYVYALDAYLLEGRRWILLCPPSIVLWANMHPSVVVTSCPSAPRWPAGSPASFVPARTWGGARDSARDSRPRFRRAGSSRVVAGVLDRRSPRLPASTRAASRSSPCPSSSRASPWFTQEINELQRPSFGLYPGPYVLAVLLLLSFLALRRWSSLVPALMVLPFAYLGLSAVRFIFVFAIVGAPVLARQRGRDRPCVERRSSRRRPAMALAAAALAVCAVSVGPRPRPGAAAR